MLKEVACLGHLRTKGKDTEHKSKNKEVELPQTKTLLHNKGNNQQSESMEWEKIFAIHISDKGLASKILTPYQMGYMWYTYTMEYVVHINNRIQWIYVVHIHNGILLSHEKEQNNAICSNMDGPRDCHTE